jgi:hypothetical protein
MMSTTEMRPSIWVGHIALHTLKIRESCEFMQQIGMRVIECEDSFALLELRGGTHLVLTTETDWDLLKNSFDLMVDNIDLAHSQFRLKGLVPGTIERGKIHDHFKVVEPGGTVILVNSSHVGDLPV